jgi:hypothetical protein
VERHLQQEVAELVPDRVVVGSVDRLQELVRLLQQVASERPMRLLAVPGAAVGLAETGLDPDQVEEAFAAAGRRDRAGRNVLERIVGHPDGGAAGDGDDDAVEDAVADGSVLAIRTTWSVVGSKRPKLGFHVDLPGLILLADPRAERGRPILR